MQTVAILLGVFLLGAWLKGNADPAPILLGAAVIAYVAFRAGRRRQAVAHSYMVYKGHQKLIRGE